MRFADDKVTKFAQQIFSNTIDLTQSAYFGTGGDEINLNCYANDTQTQELLASKNITLEDALRTFTNETHQTLLDKKRTPMVWEEMVLSHGELDVHPDTVVDIWVDSANVRAVADKGYRIVHAASDYFYLDCGHGGWVGKDGGLDSWCKFSSWQKMYS
jgi:hexosaminidase